MRLLVTLSLFLFPLTAQAADWLHWRGPEQNGVSRETNLPARFGLDPKAADSNVVWKQPYGCRSTPMIHKGHVYIINDANGGEPNEQERIVCFDADTGKVIWEYSFNVWHTDIVSSRVGWTNLAIDPETGNIYAHGTQGLLLCLSRDGKLLWSHSLTEEYGRVSGYGGRLVSPIVDENLVIVGMINASWGNHARGANRYVAFDKKTGEVVWWCELPGQIRGTYYSTPVVAVINGQRLLITGGADGAVHGIKVRTGELAWSYPYSANVINASPVVSGTRVYISHGEENLDTNIQGRIICIDAGKLDADGKPSLVWEAVGIKAGYTTPVLHEGLLYVMDDSAKLHCFEADGGKKLWEHRVGRLGRGSPVWADGKIYVFEVNARFHILQPTPEGCKSLHNQFFPGGGKGFVETNGTPSVSNGKVYLTTRDETYCIGKKEAKGSAGPIPSGPQEAAADPSAEPAHLQIVPADVVAAPGETIAFKVRAFDAKGRFLKETAATWSLLVPPLPKGAKAPPPALDGQVGKDGKLVVGKARPSQQGLVKAEVGKLSALARVRVVPPIPYSYDFNKVPDGAVPAGLVNAQGKYVIISLPDGTKAFKKLAVDSRPPLARANAYLNVPSLTDYTIQADLLGKEVRENLPDLGLVNCRYTLLFDGKKDPTDQKRRLRIVSWEAQGRVNHGVVYDWQPDVWYRAILRVDVEKDRAVVRGKVWPRAEKEPADWTIEFVDQSPNREGAPAVYGYGTGILETEPGAEGMFQNVKVTPNAGARSDAAPACGDGEQVACDCCGLATTVARVKSMAAAEEPTCGCYKLGNVLLVWAALGLAPLLLFRLTRGGA